MRGPPRLREGRDDLLAASLLDAARTYQRPASSRARILKMLGVPAAASLGATATTAVASSLLTKVMVVVAVAGAMSGGGVVAHRLHAGTQVSRVRPGPPAKQPVPPPAFAGAPAPAPAAASVPAVPTSVALVAPRPPARARRTPRSEVPAPPPATAAPLRTSLSRELELLDAAQQAERRQDHRAALASLDAYVRVFPDGALRAEAQVLRIAALLGTGEELAARQQAESFLARHPPSTLAGHVRSMLAETSRHTKELP